MDSRVGRRRDYRILGGCVDVDATEADRATVTMLKAPLDDGRLKVVGATYAPRSVLIRIVA